MNHITIGVAGHVDHGKTALVKAITGIDTDRLKEEKERGMSIVLGFAYLELNGGVVDFIDVPGHERFIRTMISGASGVDLLLLVVAANELVKPQTIEHLQLADLLGVKQGIVVLGKSDLAPMVERPRITRELRSSLAGTFLENATYQFASSVTGEGIDDLKSHFEELLGQVRAMPAQEKSFFHLPVDRVFTITGHGAVVTGTLRSGRIQVGQDVEIAPRGIHAQVRSIETHNRPVDHADPGWRTAVNLRGVKKEQLRAGDTVTVRGYISPTRQVDARIRILDTVADPLLRGAKVRMHYASDETSARVFPLEADCIAPGQTALAQIRLSDLSFMVPHEPFILRTLSPVETIGGGLVLDINPSQHSAPNAQTLAAVLALASGGVPEILAAKVCEAAERGLSIEILARELGIELQGLEAAAQTPQVVRLGASLVVHREVFDRLANSASEFVRRFHASNPTRRGISSEELRQRMPPASRQAIFGAVLAEMKSKRILEESDGLIHVAGFDPALALPEREHQVRLEIEARFKKGALKPPSAEDVLLHNKRRLEVYRFMVDQGILVEAYDSGSRKTVVFHRDAIDYATACLRSALSGGQGMTVSEINLLLDISRKYSIPLLEHLDSIGVTRRLGDKRTLKV